MTELRPMWSTTVDPSEYDVDGQMEDFVKAANKAKECYYGIDVGKLWGLYKAYKSQADELTTLRAQLAEAREALEKIANDPDCEITGSDYRIGVSDGCRQAAITAKQYLEKVITA